jgi:diguanylate cyclase (GGDEF)-like protein/PAS domain S-box-containing protein
MSAPPPNPRSCTCRRPAWPGRIARAAATALLLVGLATVSAQAREVKVGVYENPPKIQLGADGEPSGILGELLGEIARAEGWTLRAVPCAWQQCLDALRAGEIDVMPDVARTPEREALFDFHGTPALFSWSQLYQRGRVQVESMLDLRGRRIAVLDGSVQQSYLQQWLADFGIDFELVPVRSFDEGFAMAARGEVDFAAANRFYGERHAIEAGLDATPIVFQPARLYFVVPRGRHADLLAAIDRHVNDWQSRPDSIREQVIARWLAVPRAPAVPAAVWWAVGGLVGLSAAGLGVNHMLRRRVARQTRDLRASEDRLATILNSVDAFIYIKDMALRYQYANRKVCELFGRPLEQVVGRPDGDFFDAATCANLRINDLRVLEKGERVETEEANRSADGSMRATYLSIKLPLRQPDGSVYALCGISTDITRHKQAEDEIHRLAFYDPLTGLPNRRLLVDRLQQALGAAARHPEHGALLFIDVDNFKDLNDTLGHQQGDLLLRRLAERLSACVRAEDTLARQGGDEFVVMLRGLSAEVGEAVQQARRVTDKILQQVGDPFDLDGRPYRASVSIGVTLFGGRDEGLDELLKQADLAMYRAKADGRAAARFFDPDMQVQVSRRTELEAALHRALADGAFELHYQPEVDQGGRWRCVEALLRWQHPEHGMVSPRDFIPVAEASGLIVPIGRWVLDEACRKLVSWAQDPERRELRIAVNVSARQFRQPDFVEQVCAALRSTGADPHRLELELTESLLVDDIQGVAERIGALKALGVRFALDDFGTGYSSLGVLKQLPLDKLKVDQSFVRDLLTDAQDASIVRAIVTLGATLELEVVAEGVETAAQREALEALGCHGFQGYLFGRPAPM